METEITTMANIPLPLSWPLGSTHSTQNDQPKCCMAKENHMGMLQYHPKTGDIATFQAISHFNSWAEPKCYLEHH